MVKFICFLSLALLIFPATVFGGPVGSVCCNRADPDNTFCDVGLICDMQTHTCQNCPNGGVCLVNPLTSCTFGDLVDSIMKYIFIIALALAPLMIVVGAIYLMTAGGDPGKVKAAQQIFIWTAVGLLIVFLGRGLVAAINAVIGVSP